MVQGDYYTRNREAIIARAAKWNKDNRDRHNCISRKRKKVRRKMMPELFAWAGGLCSICESVENLVFHHREPSTKEFGIGDNTGNSLARIWDELDKCEVVCRACHIMIHREDLLNGKQK